MGIIRTRMTWDDHYTTIPNAWARDGRLSRRARGLLIEVLSHRVGWNVTLESLEENGPEGIYALREAIKELERVGYLRRKRIRGAGGLLGGMEYELTDPALLPTPGQQTLDDPTLDNQRERRLSSKKPILLEDQSQLSSKVGTPAPVKSKPRGAHELPVDFSISAEMQKWAVATVPDVDLDWEGKKFKAYYEGKRRTNWVTAWKNWMIKAVEFQRQRISVPMPTDQRMPLTFKDPYALRVAGVDYAPALPPDYDPWAEPGENGYRKDLQ